MPLATMNLLYLLVLLALYRPAHGTWDTCRGTCGHRPMASDYDSIAPDFSLVAGTGAQPGAWPWIVSIQDPRKIGTGHRCGGSLISPQWVLTAAHCFLQDRNVTMWRVLIGATHLAHLGPEAQVRHIKQLLVHQEYTAASQQNDIALLQLDQPVHCSDYVQPACVPNASLTVSELKSCYVAGWGSARAKARGVSDVLQEAKVRLLDIRHVNSSRRYAGTIHTHNLCAGYPQGGMDTCQGDSGGPLVCKDNSASHFWLVGVTSWGKGCARAKRTGVYTSTQHFYNWILVQMGLCPAVTTTQEPDSTCLSTPLEQPGPAPTESGCSTPTEATATATTTPEPTFSSTRFEEPEPAEPIEPIEPIEPLPIEPEPIEPIKLEPIEPETTEPMEPTPTESGCSTPTPQEPAVTDMPAPETSASPEEPVPTKANILFAPHPYQVLVQFLTRVHKMLLSLMGKKASGGG